MDEKFCPYCDSKAEECTCGMVEILQGLYDETTYSGIIVARKRQHI